MPVRVQRKISLTIFDFDAVVQLRALICLKSPDFFCRGPRRGAGRR